MTNGGVPNDPDETRPDQPAPAPPPLLRPYGASNVPEPLAPPAPPPPPPEAPPSMVLRPPPPPPPYAGYPTTRTSGLAVASLVLGIVWIFWLGSLLAVIFGHVALSQIKRSMGAVRGRGMALAGLILGYLGLVTLVGVIAAAVIVGPDASAAECTADQLVLRFEEEQYFADQGHYTDLGGLEEAGYRAHDSDLHSVELFGGGPSNATGYSIVNEDRCD